MYNISVDLGTCIGMKINPPISYWTVLDHYGISSDDLKKLDLKYEELFHIYKTLQQHEQIREFIKNLKKKINLTTNR